MNVQFQQSYKTDITQDLYQTHNEVRIEKMTKLVKISQIKQFI